MSQAIRCAVVAAVILLAAIHSTDATFHLMLIIEIYPGSHANPEAQYVVLQSTFSGQNLLAGHPIRTQNADGSVGPVFGTFAGNPANTASGARYLMGTTQAQALFGNIALDGVATGRLPFPNGRICFDSDLVDCVAYGAFSGSNGVYGSPATALVRQQALKRRSNTNNNANDFFIGAPNPINSFNQTRPDGDGDGIPDISDCAPSNSSLYLRPLEVANLRVARIPDVSGFVTRIDWDDQSLLVGSPTRYDIVSVDRTVTGAVEPFLGVGCSQNDLTTPSGADPFPDPPGGTVRLFLARGQNGCGDGTYGDGTATPDPRDILDDPAQTPCP